MATVQLPARFSVQERLYWPAMGSNFKNSALVAAGVLAGVALSMQFSSIASKQVADGIPMEELQQLAQVYGVVKSDYVEEVDDKQLMTDAMTGMVASLADLSHGCRFCQRMGRTTAVTRETWTVQSPNTLGMAGLTSRMIRPACALTGLL